MHIPTRFTFDSAAAFSRWLSWALPILRCAPEGDGVAVRGGVFSAVILRAKFPDRVELEDVIPSRVVTVITGWLQFLCAQLPLLAVHELYAGIDTPRVFDRGSGAVSAAGVSWHFGVFVTVLVCGMAPRWLVNAISRSGCEQIRRQLAALFSTGTPGAR